MRTYRYLSIIVFLELFLVIDFFGYVDQLAESYALGAYQCEFESHRSYLIKIKENGRQL